MSKIRVTPELLIKAHNSFLGNRALVAGILFSRPELRALERKGYLKKRMARHESGSLFWLYFGTSKLFSKEKS